MNKFYQVDQELFLYLHQAFRHPIGDLCFKVLSSNYLYAVLVVLLIVYAYKRRQWSLLTAVVMAALSASMADFIAYEWLKPFFARLRPCHVHKQSLELIAGCAGTYGFPSNHGTNAMAVAVSLWAFAGWRWGVSAVMFAILIGTSRVYLGVHYPLDILAGFLVGGVLALLIYYITKPLFFWRWTKS